ncbi:DUF3131 domain-containing protein [Halodurantibacterium flavum]|uniref:DUF3131 domain-containing protein n=1 Tax=Halodurantibacterium flavum TaxID=1382802 RepID=A0ABW4S4W2_9RHOB
MRKIARSAILCASVIAPTIYQGGDARAQTPDWAERPLSVTEPVAMPRRGELTPAEMEMARQAWVYFENNTQPGTGLVNASHNFPSTTLWDVGSALAATVSAHGLGIIDDAELNDRLDRILKTLGSLDLFQRDCPNKAYDTRTAVPTNYLNEPGEIGCSAIDIARLLSWLRIVEQRFPERQPKARHIVTRWNWCQLVQDGFLYGAALDGNGNVIYLQEGRLGYEEYSARAFQLWGFDVEAALAPEPYETLWMYGVEIPYDARDPRVLGAQNYVVTESYALLGIEFGLGDPAATDVGGWIARAAQNIYEVQARRHQATGILTARTEHQLLESPFFVYDTIFSDGRPWATITEAGNWVPQHAAVALKGALGLWALWETPYTDLLFDAIAPQFDPERGFYEGIYEDGRGAIRTQTANNNGIMLETLFFKAYGPILREVVDPTGWVAQVDPAQGRCLPERASLDLSGGETIRIMPLGASNTYGMYYNPASRGGYRGYLYDLMSEDGIAFDFVGMDNDGDIPDADHNGYPGQPIEWFTRPVNEAVDIGGVAYEIFSGDQPASVHLIEQAEMTPDDIVLLLAGTNNVRQGDSAETMLGQMQLLLDQIVNTAGGPEVHVMTLTTLGGDYWEDGDPTRTNNDTIRLFNEGLAQLVETQYGALGVRLVDVEAADIHRSPDGVHLSEEGYRMVAEAWHSSIRAALESRLID